MVAYIAIMAIVIQNLSANAAAVAAGNQPVFYASMIETTGYFIAPQNATAEIQALANRIVPDVREDGVAQVIEELYRTY